MKVDKLMTEVDHGARQRYEERAAHSELGPRASRSEPAAGATPPSAKPLRDRRWASMGRIYDATWGRGFAALYDRGLKATEEAGLREMRRETLAEASGRTIDLGAGTGANLDLFRRRSPSWSWPSPTRT